MKGTDWRVNCLFFVCGAWNLVYYPALDRWASFWGSVVFVVAHGTWVFLYLRIEREKKVLPESSQQQHGLVNELALDHHYPGAKKNNSPEKNYENDPRSFATKHVVPLLSCRGA
ncbi:hypothetical protein F6455_13090 [Proteobacteria bacterium 005FR1]|nr:hypothetical protein [Proteobacteria bacterium 005FR1]